MPIWIEYTICRSCECEYESTDSNNRCTYCGSFDTYNYTVVFEGEDNE